MGESSRVAVGIDVGGTKIAGGVVDEHGTVTELVRVRTPRTGDEVVRALCAMAIELSARARDDGREVSGVGVGTGGVVDPETGRVLASTDLIEAWSGVDVARPLQDAVRLPVRIDNDGNAFALAEARWGAARDCADALCVAVGTGVGGGVVLGGALRHGPRHIAGEFGHVPWPTERLCSCGLAGHVEAVASGPSMTSIYAERSGQPVGGLPAVVARRSAGDKAASDVFDEGARALGAALAGLLVALDIRTVVLGGGVAQVGDWYRDAVAQAIDQTLPHGNRADVRPAAQGPLSSVAGAGGLALSQPTRTVTA